MSQIDDIKWHLEINKKRDPTDSVFVGQWIKD